MMTKSVVLVLSDGGHLHDDTEDFLRRKGHDVITDPDSFGDAFAQDSHKIILIAYQDLEQGLECYNRVVAEFSLGCCPHYSVILCISKDASAAAELCLNQTVDNYFIVKPIYDMHRLALLVKQADDAVVHAEQQMALACIGEELVEHKRELDYFIISNIDKGVECQTDTVNAFSAALNELTELIAGHYDHHLIMEHNKVAEQTRQLSDRKLRDISEWAETAKEGYNEINRLKMPDVSENKRNIALIGSDSKDTVSVQQTLFDCGYNPVVFASAREALPAMICRKPDLLLLDYEVSDLSALKVLAYMHKFNQLTDIPVILLTELRDKEILSACLKAGARDFIVTPADKETLCDKISKLLPDYQAQT